MKIANGGIYEIFVFVNRIFILYQFSLIYFGFQSIPNDRKEFQPGKNSNLKPMTPPHPLAQQINKRLRTQLKLIQKGLRTGKLTKEQAISLRESIKSTRQQMLAFLKQNGNFELTTDQQKQLNRGLDSNSSTIDERPAIINR